MTVRPTHGSTPSAATPKRTYATPSLKSFGTVTTQTKSGGATYSDGGGNYSSLPPG